MALVRAVVSGPAELVGEMQHEVRRMSDETVVVEEDRDPRTRMAIDPATGGGTDKEEKVKHVKSASVDEAA